ncbi:hypothetical protein PAUR_b0761 [Pseudoalteromonas aurantia 208]|uniref:Uncharacterized protein n=1 Tax=Pseudoalteromonas aurantia 208 TaxID=1314867 RepID=A0ABR9EIA5_9GAMM|nr:hypothetical protein [Pseudoalteromonas aurantia 208]
MGSINTVDKATDVIVMPTPEYYGGQTIIDLNEYNMNIPSYIIIHKV